MTNSNVEEFVLACLPPTNAHRSGSLDVTRKSLEKRPELATATVVTAVLTGELEDVKSAMATDPQE